MLRFQAITNNPGGEWMLHDHISEDQIKQILDEIDQGVYVGQVCQKYKVPRKLINSWKRHYRNLDKQKKSSGPLNGSANQNSTSLTRLNSQSRSRSAHASDAILPDELARIVSIIEGVPENKPLLRNVVKTVEKEMISYYLRTNKRVVDAYCALGISRTNLDLKREEYGLKN